MMQTDVSKPLFGKRILVTRNLEEASALSQRLRKLGAIPVEFPAIEINPVNDTSQLDQAIRNVNEYDWIIFTSAHGAQFFLKRMNALGLQIQDLATKVAAIGPSTASFLEQAGKKVDYVPSEFLSEKIPAGLGNLREKRVLLPRTNIASKKLPELLRKQGALVDDIITYQTVAPKPFTAERLRTISKERIDIAIFTSPSTVRNLAQVLGSDVLSSLLQHAKIACIGPVTAEAARELAIDVDVIAKIHTIDELVKAVVNEIGIA